MQKQAYVEPTVTEIGTVSALTQLSGGGGGLGGSGGITFTLIPPVVPVAG